MTDGRIKPTAQFSQLLRRISEEMRAHAPSGKHVDADRFVEGQPAARAAATEEAWDAVVASSLQFWSADPGPVGLHGIVVAEVVRALDGLEGALATGEAAALLEDHRRLQHGFEIVYGGALPHDVREFLGELQALLVDWTGDFVTKLKTDLLQSRTPTLQILDEDARACATIVFDALGRRQPIDHQVLDVAIQNLRATLSQSDYKSEHTADLDVLAKRLEWLHAAVGLRSPVLESR